MNPAADPINIKRDRDADKKKRLEEERLKAELEANKEEGNGAREIFLLEKRRRYGISLATLASKPSKRLEICQDGAVSTLAKLSMSNDRQTLLSVAAAFNSLAASPECRKFLITEGAVQGEQVFDLIVELRRTAGRGPRALILFHGHLTFPFPGLLPLNSLRTNPIHIHSLAPSLIASLSSKIFR